MYVYQIRAYLSLRSKREIIISMGRLLLASSAEMIIFFCETRFLHPALSFLDREHLACAASFYLGEIIGIGMRRQHTELARLQRLQSVG